MNDTPIGKFNQRTIWNFLSAFESFRRIQRFFFAENSEETGKFRLKIFGDLVLGFLGEALIFCGFLDQSKSFLVLDFLGEALILCGFLENCGVRLFLDWTGKLMNHFVG
jgi:hypothetical protein